MTDIPRKCITLAEWEADKPAAFEFARTGQVDVYDDAGNLVMSMAGRVPPLEDGYTLAEVNAARTEGHAAGVTAERERWRAVVDGAIAKHANTSRTQFISWMNGSWSAKTLERVLLEILEAMEQKA